VLAILILPNVSEYKTQVPAGFKIENLKFTLEASNGRPSGLIIFA
jgi:hypothetical protein